MSTETPSDVRSSVSRPDSTAEVLQFLRAARSEYRTERRKSAVFVAYLLVLFGGVWGVPALLAVARLGQSSRLDRSEPLLHALPLWLPAVLALASLLVVRSAVWRGPVVADSATVSWLLPQPIARGPLLLPRLVSSATVSALLGMASGGVLGFLIGNVSGAAWFSVTAAGVWAGLGTALVGTGLSVLIVRHEVRWERQQRRIFQAGWCGVALLGLLSVIALTRGLPTWAGTTVLWLLPWGWAAQPLTAAALGTAPGWPLAMLMWACGIVVPALLAVRAVPDIPGEALRLRATVADRMGASLFSLDLRRARSAMRVRQRRGARPASWVRPPRLPWLVLPWRDALCLVREPGRLGWGCAWSALSIAALAFASARTGTTATLSSCAAVWFLYLAAAQFVEPARLESDDMRRSALLPYRAGTLALWHAVVPGLLLAAATGLGLAVCVVGGWWTPALAAVLAAVPASVGAALVGAYRGPVPFHLLVGTETAMGNTAPIQTAVWYLRGLLALMALTAPVVVAAAADGSCGPQRAAWLLLVGIASLLWARRTARRLNA
nr:ABC transporter [Streptomyces sp. RK44]